MYVTYRNMYMTYIRIAYHRLIMYQNIKFATALVRIVHHLHVDIHSLNQLNIAYKNIQTCSQQNSWTHFSVIGVASFTSLAKNHQCASRPQFQG